MDNALEFKKIVAQYTEIKAEDMTDDMRFREDLGFSSLDFMSLLLIFSDICTYKAQKNNEDVSASDIFTQEMLDSLTEE